MKTKIAIAAIVSAVLSLFAADAPEGLSHKINVTPEIKKAFQGSDAIEIKEIEGERSFKPDDLFFPNRKGEPISDMTMNKVLRDAGLKWDVHGFRSAFRDWAAEQMPLMPDAVAEAAMAHQVPDKVMRAYKRTNFIADRRTLLEAWGAFVTSAPTDPK